MSSTLLCESLSTVEDIVTAGEMEGHRLVAIHGDATTLQEVGSPVIAHLETLRQDGNYGGHFVVVTHCDEDSVTFIDGTTAETNQISAAEFLEVWTGVLIAYRQPRSTFFRWITLGVFFALVFYGFFRLFWLGT